MTIRISLVPNEMLTIREAFDLEPGVHNMLGIRALFHEMQEQGVGYESLLKSTGLLPSQIDDSRSHLTSAQKITIFRNVLEHTRVPDVGLKAGMRQRLSDFGVYGYALVSSDNFGDAVTFGFKHLRLIGPVLEKRFRVDGQTAIFSGHDFLSLGEVLPLATEYWLASILRLMSCILEKPFPSRKLVLPYAKPRHVSSYDAVFDCPIEFNAKSMEWHFDANLLQEACPNANPITADICQGFCQRVLNQAEERLSLPQSIRVACLNSRGLLPTADAMAARLGMSVRTMHRRLSLLGQSYQGIVDEVRQSLAKEYLQGTTMSVEEIAHRVGFSETTNFRRAFKKWTGLTPVQFRQN